MNVSTNYSYSFGLSLLRVIISIIIIKNIVLYIPISEELFGKNSFYKYETYSFWMDYYSISFLKYPFYLPNFSLLFLVSMLIVTFIFMFSIRGILFGIILYVMIIVLKIRNGFILDGSDNVIQVIFPFLLLSDSFKHFSYKNKSDITYNTIIKYIHKYFHIAILIQVCFVYFFTGYAKAQGELWNNGTAIYYTMRVQDFMALDINLKLTENLYFVVTGTYLTLFWELSFAFLVWFSRTKYYILLLGVFIHLGIFIFMRIDNFSWVMISTYLVFISNREYVKFFIFIKSFKHKLTKNYISF